MARKKSTPQKAKEYKSKPPGKAKDGSTCYTRQNKSGGKYITCTGTQGKGKAKSPAPTPAAKPKKKTSTIGGIPKGTKVKVGTLNPGKLIKDAPKASGSDKGKEALKKAGITRDLKEDEVRMIFQGGKLTRMISGDDEKFIERIQKLAGWTTDYAPLSAAQRKRLLSLRGKNDIFLRPSMGMGSSSTTKAVDVVRYNLNQRGRVVFTELPTIRFKFLKK